MRDQFQLIDKWRQEYSREETTLFFSFGTLFILELILFWPPLELVKEL